MILVISGSEWFKISEDDDYIKRSLPWNKTVLSCKVPSQIDRQTLVGCTVGSLLKNRIACHQPKIQTDSPCPVERFIPGRLTQLHLDT